MTRTPPPRIRQRIVGSFLALTALTGGALVGRALAADVPDAVGPAADAGPITAGSDVPADATEPSTVEIAVVAPIGSGDEPPAANADGSAVLSERVGQTIVPIVDDPPPAPVPDETNLLDGLDPAAVESAIVTATAGTVDAAVAAMIELDLPTAESLGISVIGAEDPCVRADTTDLATGVCPEGVRTVVVALTSPPIMRLIVSQIPEPPAELTPRVQCPAETPAAGTVGISVYANVPGETLFTYRAIGTTEWSNRTLSTSDLAAESWLARFAEATVYNEPALDSLVCFALDGIEPGVRYEALVEHRDLFERSTRTELTFGDLDEPTRRRPQVVRLDDHRVLAAIPVGPNDSAAIETFDADLGGACSSTSPTSPGYAERGTPAIAEELPNLEIATTELEAANEMTHVNQYRMWVVYLAEGETYRLCAGVWRAEGGTSFDRDAPIVLEAFTIAVADVVIPQLRVHSVETVRRLQLESIHLGFQQFTGSDMFSCGGYVGPNDAEVFDTSTGSPCSPLGYARLGLRTRVAFGGRTYESSVAFAGLEQPCADGRCPDPTVQWLRVALPIVDIPVGGCGIPIGASTCERPTEANSIGSALVRVDWDQGETNGASELTITAGTDIRPSTDRSALPPSMNTDAVWNTVADPGDVLRLSSTTALTADRPVVWSVRAWPSDPAAAVDCTFPTDGVVVSSDPAAPVARFTPRFEGLCAGVGMRVEAVLTDPTTGLSQTYSPSRNWYGGHLWTPGPLVHLRVTVEVAPPSRSPRSHYGFYPIDLSAPRHVPMTGLHRATTTSCEEPFTGANPYWTRTAEFTHTVSTTNEFAVSTTVYLGEGSGSGVIEDLATRLPVARTSLATRFELTGRELLDGAVREVVADDGSRMTITVSTQPA